MWIPLRCGGMLNPLNTKNFHFADRMVHPVGDDDVLIQQHRINPAGVSLFLKVIFAKGSLVRDYWRTSPAFIFRASSLISAMDMVGKWVLGPMTSTPGWRFRGDKREAIGN